MADQKRLGIFLSYIVIILNIISGVVVTPLIINIVGKAEYGLYQLVAAIIASLLVLDFGFGNTITRYVCKYNAEHKKKDEENFLFMGFAIYFFIALIVYLIGFILYLNLDKIFAVSLTVKEIAKAKWLFLIMIITFSFSLFSNVYSGITTAYEKFIFTNLTKIINLILRISLVIVLLFIYHDSLVIVLTDLALTVIFFLISVIYVHITLKVKIKYHFYDKLLLKEVLIFSFFIFLQIIINQVNSNVGKFLIGMQINTVAVGIYSIAIQIYSIYSSLSSTISGIYLPSITNMVVNNASKDDIVRYIIPPSRFQLMLLGGIFTGFCLFGKGFIELWVGSGFLSAWWLGIIIMLPSTVELTQNLILSILKAQNRMGIRSLINIITAALNVVISVILIKYFGIFGAAFGTAISMLIGAVIIANLYYHFKLGFNMKLFFKGISKGILPSILLSAGLCSFLYFLPNGKPFIFILSCIVFTVVYLTILWLVGLNDSEKKLFSGFIKHVSKRRTKN